MHNKILLAAALDPEGVPLTGLVAEIRAIETALRPLQERGIAPVLSNRAAAVQDIFEVFSQEKDKIAVFHYAGHANQQELRFEGGGHVKGIAGLLGLTQGRHLRFVFLNGCASAGLVKSLHEAGVGAVLATTCPVGDEAALRFAKTFYQEWAKTDTTLNFAFEMAKNAVDALEKSKQRDIAKRSSFEMEDTGDGLPWGLYLNAALSEAEQTKLADWCLHRRPQLPPQLLGAVKTKPMESLEELLYEFRAADDDARAELEADDSKDALLVLITRLPWMIGTHLRRLFALDESQSMALPGMERLRELVSAYNALTRFISYTALSALWDDRQKKDEAAKFEGFRSIMLLPDEATCDQTDHIHTLRQSFAVLDAIVGDPIGLEAHIKTFLQAADTELSEGYRLMEELKLALSDTDNRRLDTLTGNTTNGLETLCLQVETIFARFLQAALFLTQYKLYSVRAISVDKMRLLDMEQPFVHRTMMLHAAFSDIKLLPTPRTDASDNYCILLAPRHYEGKDPLRNALNLSPFYLDRNAFLSAKSDQYPAVFVLRYQRNSQEFVYQYVDRDVNHAYSHAEDLNFTIKKFGATFPEALEISRQDTEKFVPVFRQLLKFSQDFAT
jgi:CHAT domain